MKLLLAWSQLDENHVNKIQQETSAEILRTSDKEELPNLLEQAEVIFGYIRPELLSRAVRCRWMQIPYAGAETVLAASWGNADMVLTNGSGIFGPNIAEHVIGMMLAFNRGLHFARDYQHKRQWRWEEPYQFRELTDSLVGVLGFGDIGQHVAQRLSGFGCRVIGFRTQPRGDERHVEAVYALDEVDKFLGQLDYVVCALPHTEKTSGFLNGKRLTKLPRHAVVINVGRGSLIPEEDLYEVLSKGKIAGAGLDVLPEEPLPAESRLWELPNLIISPHNSGYTPFHADRALEIFLDNWRSFVKTGSPHRNVVDRERGY